MVKDLSNQRHKNIADMTVIEQLSNVAQEVCDKLCKYPELCKQTEDSPEDAQELLDRMYCANCPLNRI